ncbi:hypothetical protein D3C78_1506600 [compost metagenome]
MVKVLPMSEPAACSVMNIAPWAWSSKSVAVSWAQYLPTSSGAPNLRSVRVSESVIDSGQHRPNSACTNR